MYMLYVHCYQIIRPLVYFTKEPDGEREKTIKVDEEPPPLERTESVFLTKKMLGNPEYSDEEPVKKHCTEPKQ